MEKKDIYDHLAKVYLGNPAAAQTHQEPAQEDTSKNKTNDYGIYIFVGIAAIIIIVALFSLSPLFKQKNFSSQSYLVLNTEPVRINYRFEPVKKEIYSVDLKSLNLTPYKSLSFALKKNNAKGPISLRLEVTSKFKEKSEVYLKDIPQNWKEYEIPFSEFKNISSWAQISNLSFIIEEWNSKDNTGTVYIDNLKVIK